MKIEYISEGIRAAEKVALNKIADTINNAPFSQHWQGFAGFEMVDRVYRDREIDFLLVTHDRLVAVELKDWFGKVTLMHDHWLREGNGLGRSAVTVTADKKKILSAKIKAKLHSRANDVWIDYRVVMCGNSDTSALPIDKREWVCHLAEFLFDRLRSSLTLTHSQWTRNKTADLCGISSEVLYPPAAGDFTDTPWQQREDSFVNIGRLTPIKRQDFVIETLALVRREWPELKLHVCGSAAMPDYLGRLEKLAAMHGPWVQIHQDLSRQDLIALLSRCRYGIHACVDEHFGVAPAELARAGCVPFVHASGRQVEIVDQEPHLCFTTAEDAAAKILAVMRDNGLQRKLQAVVSRRSPRFAPDTFVREFLVHVEAFLGAKSGASAHPALRSL
jgi:glycosyltransferase involved in cell wall biosynthesis